MTRSYGILFTALLLLLTACKSDALHDRKRAEEGVRQFAADFFNYRYDEALKQCTASSRYAVSVYVSNLTTDDVERIRSIDVAPTVSVRDVVLNVKDSTGLALCDVENVFVLDSLDSSGRMVDKATYALDLRFEEGAWKVRMEGPLQSGT